MGLVLWRMKGLHACTCLKRVKGRGIVVTISDCDDNLPSYSQALSFHVCSLHFQIVLRVCLQKNVQIPARLQFNKWIWKPFCIKRLVWIN